MKEPPSARSTPANAAAISHKSCCVGSRGAAPRHANHQFCHERAARCPRHVPCGCVFAGEGGAGGSDQPHHVAQVVDVRIPREGGCHVAVGIGGTLSGTRRRAVSGSRALRGTPARPSAAHVPENHVERRAWKDALDSLDRSVHGALELELDKLDPRQRVDGCGQGPAHGRIQAE